MENGGVLDGIIFVVKTEVPEDLAYLEELLASNPSYTAQYQHQGGFDYSQMWNSCEKGVMYVKIDDDVVSLDRIDTVGALIDNVGSSILKTRPSDPS